MRRSLDLGAKFAGDPADAPYVEYSAPDESGVLRLSIHFDAGQEFTGEIVVGKPQSVIDFVAQVQEALTVLNAAGIGARLEAFVRDIEEESRDLVPVPATAFEPFPIDALPETLRDFCSEASVSIGVDPSMVALPALVACAGAIGNTRRIRLKADWVEPPVIWGAIVAESGAAKTPAFNAAMGPLHEEQAKALADHKKDLAAYEINCGDYEAAIARRKRELSEGKSVGPAPTAPEKPVARRLLCSDVTIEGLVALLELVLRGLISAHDELSGWFRAMSQYKSGRGSDVGHWLSMHSAGPVVVDRKGSVGEPITVRRAAVCLIGGIQPGVLRECVAGENRENGMFARFLLVQPPRIRRAWTDEEISPETATRYASLLKTLWALEFDDQAEGSHEPIELELAPNAKLRFVELFEELADIQHGKVGFEASAWSKLEAYFPRLALIIHAVRRAEGGADPLDREPVSLEAIEAAYTLVRWFGRQLDHVLGRIEETNLQTERRQLLEYIEQRGGSLTVRELALGLRRFRGRSADARAALEELAEERTLKKRLERAGDRGPHATRYYLAHAAPPGQGGYRLCTGGPENETCSRSQGDPSYSKEDREVEGTVIAGSSPGNTATTSQNSDDFPVEEPDPEEVAQAVVEGNLQEDEGVATATGCTPDAGKAEPVATRVEPAESGQTSSSLPHSLHRYPSAPCAACAGTCFHWLEGCHEPVCSECEPPKAHDRVIDATVLLDEEVA